MNTVRYAQCYFRTKPWLFGVALWIGFCFSSRTNWITATGSLFAQQVQFGVPMQTMGNRYFEKSGISWRLGIPGRNSGGTRVMGISPSGQLTPGINVSYNSGNFFPPFGGYDLGTGGRLDLNGRNFRLGLSMAKGSRTWLSSQEPTLVVQNGFGGSIFSGQVRPFATGFVPVVGSQPNIFVDNAVTRAVHSGLLDSVSSTQDSSSYSQATHLVRVPKSTATTGDKSVAEIKREREMMMEARRAKLKQLVAEAEILKQQEQNSQSRRKYIEAIRYADDPTQRSELRILADALKPAKR